MNTSMSSFRGARRQSVPAAASAWVGPTGAGSGLPLQVGPHTDVDLAGWAGDHADLVTRWLDTHGAVLFRGFRVSAEQFPPVARALAGAAVPYRERSSPRTELSPGVYTSTDYPADQPIPLHNENSYQRAFPARLVFCCLVPAEQGGETPLADCRRVLARIDRAAVSSFRSRQVRYVRNYSQGAGLTWQEAFQQSDPGQVDSYCREQGITVGWGAGGTLRTEQVRPALGVHPRTREPVWFNHAAFFHSSALPPPVREALLAQLGEEGLPANAYYGDGTPIDEAVLAGIRAAYAAETVAVPWRRGDVLLVDNLLVAHGRAAFTGPRRVVVSMGGSLRHEDLPSAGAERR